MSDQYDGPELTRQIYLRNRRITALERERDVLRVALISYGKHDLMCGVRRQVKCDCGLNAALAAKGGK